MFTPWRLRQQGENVCVYQPTVILKPEVVSLADGVRIDSFCKIEGGLGVSIGVNAHIASFSHINGGGGNVIFGSHSGCASGVKIAGGYTDYSYLYVSAAEPDELCHTIKKVTVIGEFVVIFSNAVILPGVTVGDGAIVAAGSVVTKDVEPWTIVAGVPAKFIKHRETIGR